MQTSAINSLFKLSEKTTFIQNWKISKRIDTPCRKKTKTLDSMPSRQFVKKGFKPNYQENLSKSIMMIDQQFVAENKPKTKKYVPMIKHKMQPKKILVSFLQKSLLQSQEGDSGCSTINLYHPVLQTPQKQQKIQRCYFSNSRIIESLYEQASTSPFKSDDPKQYSRCFQSCLIKQQKSYSKLRKLYSEQKSVESLHMKRELTSKLKLRCSKGNNFICRKRGNKKYFLNIVQ